MESKISWIVFDPSLSDELTLPYVQEQLSKNEEISVASYISWSNKNTNPNFKSAEAFTLTWLHSLFLFRAAIRQCNPEVALAAREKASSIFFGFNHPRYREYSCSDFFWLLSVPEECKPLIWSQSSRREGSDFGQAIDFLLEERNKAMKTCVFYSDIPTFEQWRTASCVMNKVEEVNHFNF